MTYKEYTIVRINDAYLNKMLVLFKMSFGQSPTYTYLANKFKTSYQGSSWVGYIALTEAGEPAAYYGVFPMNIELNGKTVKAAQSGDTMTSPFHQGKGLFTYLAIQTYELCKKEGIEIVWGFPNENSIYGFEKKLNWKILNPLKQYKFRVYTVPLSYFASKNNLFRLFYQLWTKLILELFTKEKNLISHNSQEVGVASVKKTIEYLNYRCFSNNFMINSGRCKAWIKFEGNVMIGDVVAINQTEFNRLIRKIHLMCILLGVNRYWYCCSPNHPNSLFFNKVCSPIDYYSYGYLSLNNNIYINDFQFTASDIDTF